MADTRGRGGTDERAVRVEPIGRLRARDHQHGAGAVEGPPDRLAIGVVRRADLGLGHIGSTGRIPNDQAERRPASRQFPGDQAADAPGRPGDGDHAASR